MPLSALIPLLLQYTIPFVDKIFTIWSSDSNAQVTQADWDTLKALASQNATTQMLAALARAGIDPKSPQGVALLSQVPA